MQKSPVVKKVFLLQVLLAALGLVSAIYVTDVRADDELEQDENQTLDLLEEVVVTGVRLGLRNALRAKREANSIIDVVAAEDIGKLPDITIAESLARLPGLAADRDRGNASNISIRGLGPNLSNTLLNGREIVTGDASRNVQYSQYPSELVTGAYVFKSPVAKQIAGGVGGTIDLKTVKPLDYDARVLTINGRLSYNDLASDITDSNSDGYRASFSYIDQFLSDTLGIAIGYALRQQPIATARTNIFPYTNSFADINEDGNTSDLIPFGYEYLVRGGEDTRNGLITALQWRPSDALLLSADILYSTFDFQEEQRGFRAENLAFGNTFSKANLVNNAVVGITAAQTEAFGLSLSTVNEEFTFEDELFAGGLNFLWDNDNIRISGDIAYSENEREARFVSVQTEVHGISGAAPVQLKSGLEGTFGSKNGRGFFDFNVDLSDPAINLPTEVKMPTANTVIDELFSAKLDAEYYFTGS